MKRFFVPSFLIVLFVSSLLCSPPPGFHRNRKTSHRNYRHSYVGNGIVRTAKRYQGVPYRMGGSSPRGFDCSGYVMYIYGKHHIPLPRTAEAQFYHGRAISLSRARPGDLVFFQTSRRRYSHVGIYIGGGRFIHAPSTGKRVSVTEMKNPYWKKRYRGAVTYF